MPKVDQFYKLIPRTDEPTTSIVVDDEKPCIVCGTPTKFIDYCFESRFCSRSCQDKFCDEIMERCAEY